MKKKDIRKISNYLFKRIEDQKKKTLKAKSLNKAQLQPEMESDPWCEHDVKVSEKLVKLVNNLLKYPDNVNISHSEYSINIRVDDIKNVKKRSYTNNGHYAKVSNEEDNLSIEIIKGKGFSVNLGYRKYTRYSDINLYTEMIDKVKERVKEINAENFNDIWETISKESGLLRDSNLEEIFDSIK